MKTAIDEAKCRHSVLRPVKLYKNPTEGSSAPSNVPHPCVEEPTESVWKVLRPIGFITATTIYGFMAACCAWPNFSCS